MRIDEEPHVRSKPIDKSTYTAIFRPIRSITTVTIKDRTKNVTHTQRGTTTDEKNTKPWGTVQVLLSQREIRSAVVVVINDREQGERRTQGLKGGRGERKGENNETG